MEETHILALCVHPPVPKVDNSNNIKNGNFALK